MGVKLPGVIRHLSLAVALGLGLGLAACTPSPRPEPARSWARPLTDRRFERTPERRERGRYLAEGVLQCAICHSERDDGEPGAPPRAGRAFAGAVLWDDSTGRVVAPNLTPDRRTGAGSWTDDMLARAIREGVGHDGRALHPRMWSQVFRALSDEELASVVVYLRSLPPVRNALPPTRIPEKRRRRIEAALRPLLEPVPTADTADALARGLRLVTLADCGGCHTAWEAPRTPGILAGGNRVERGATAAFSVNVTPDASGLGDWEPETFIEVMRTGKQGTLDPIMPWVAFRNLSDRDLSEMFAYLRTRPAAVHWVDNHSEPDSCAACGQSHGLGARNRLEKPAGIHLDARTLSGYAGTYRSAEHGFERVIAFRSGRLFGSEDGGPEIELVPVSRERFVAPGWVAPIEFRRDPAGRVTGHVSIEVGDIWLERVER